MTIDPRLILGRIVTVNGPEQGRASLISYTIAVHDSSVEGVYRLNRQVPLQRWPDQVDIRARQVGDIVIGTVSANRVQWHFHEYPAFAACPGSANLGDGLTPEELELLRLRDPRFAVGTVPGSGQESTPAPSEQ